MTRLPIGTVWLLRVIVCLVWLHEGLWLKVICQAPHELSVVRDIATGSLLTPETLLSILGWGEVVLALAVLSGRHARPLAWIQGFLIVAMNGTALALARGSIDDPSGLVVKNLPLLACIALLR